MRKIEEQMNEAVANSKNWQSANTSVTYCPESEESKVYLHGNHIATVGDTWMELFDGGWQSNTTKSRLNALLSAFGIDGEKVFQKDYKWFLMQDGGAIPFFSGMRLV